MRAEEGFQFPALTEYNRWDADAAFRAAVTRHLSMDDALSKNEVSRLTKELHSFGERCNAEYKAIGATMDGPSAEPRLIQYDAWGNRIDRLVTSSGWKELKEVAAKEGIVAESYDLKGVSGGGRSRIGACARVYAFAKVVVFGPYSKVVLCPVSMSDGAVRVLELFGTQAQKDFAIPHLLSIDPKENWTAGQWMTERPGGSDVSRTETTATPVKPGSTSKGDKFILNGFKWFSSATDGDVALALARTDSSLPSSSKGLSLFLLKIRDEKTGKLNGIRVHRLKNKMGTKYLPTAELELDGCVGEVVGELGRGVATISSVLNITRLYSASGALAGLGHGLQIATSFAQSREVMQSKRLSDLHLHTATLLRVAVLYRALLQLFFSNVLLIGKVETGVATPEEALRLRFLTPALKAFSATRASEGYITLIESLGGQGYQEECGLSECLRDLTVERIWEGTASVLSLDVLRVMAQSKGAALFNFIKDNMRALESLPSRVKDAAQPCIRQLQDALQQIGSCIQKVDMARLEVELDYRIARPLLDCIMTTLAGVLLLEQAAWCLGGGSEGSFSEDLEAAQLWILGGHGDLDRCLTSLRELSSSQSLSSSATLNQRIVYGSSSLPRSSL